MGARVIDSRGLAAELKEELAAEVAGLRDAGVVSGLATVLVGSPAEVETATKDGNVETDTIFARSARGERIIR